ncbi:MAG TPA: EF-P beta-lysylation protein EpmB [Gammaproteobacteria bacterium]|nr:EF-P beta-lysylation protein EpmB [Gammaproteobacteria bacterium]
MIPRSAPPEHLPRWQRELQRAITRVDRLLELLEIDPRSVALAGPAAARFPVRVPRGFAARMRPGDPDDPLLRQVLPGAAEDRPATGYGFDPLDEERSMVAPGVLHKYRGRALLTVTGACAVHCRYCFRRHFPYGQANPTGAWERVLGYLADSPQTREVILSGGDPLSLTDERLAALSTGLEAPGHVHRLRIHTRTPIVLPERVDRHLLGWLAASRLQVVMVVHCNHPREIDDAVAEAMRHLRAAGVSLFNQSVLLRGVNDDPDILCALSERLFDLGVIPYYLHQLDKVQGAAHFEVDDAAAHRLMDALHGRLSGYLVPRLVREQAGAPGKTLLWPA